MKNEDDCSKQNNIPEDENTDILFHKDSKLKIDSNPINKNDEENPIDIFLEEVDYTSFHYNTIFIISMMYFFVGSEFIKMNIMLSTLQPEWSLKNSDLSLMGSSIFLGVAITSIIAGPVNNAYGRKNPSIIGCITLSIFSISSGFSNSFHQLFIINTFVGMSIGIIIPGTTSLLAECIPKKNRSLTLNSVWGLYPLGIIYTCYIAINYIKRNTLDWRTLCFVNSLTSILIVFLSFYLKESPRYLIVEKKYDQAFDLLNLIGKQNNKKLSSDLEERIKKYNEKCSPTKSDSISAYFEGDFKLITPCLIFLWYSTSIISYGLLYIMPKYFDNLTKKDKSDSLKNLIVSMYILFFCPYLRGYISEIKFLGRKYSLAIGFLGAVLFSFLCVIDESNLSFYAGSLNFFINISLGLISVYTAEVYCTNLRSGALGIGNMFTRIGGLTAPFICDFLEKFLAKGSFHLFILIGFVSIILCFVLRETRGKDLK
jgi:MFS family permease